MSTEKKLGRQRNKYRQNELVGERRRQESEPVTGLYFDGRKDPTLALKVKNGKTRKIVKVEEHYTLIEEPGSRYLAHLTPKDGTGLEIAKTLYKRMESIEGLNSLKVIGGDGCSGNTGYRHGVVACLESFMGRPLQIFFCLLHAN